MRGCLLKRQKRTKRVYCMHSFRLVTYIASEQEELSYKEIITLFENDEKFKMYNVCYWLSGRKIPYKLSFRYDFEKSIKWNIIRYRNYLRLKVRLRERRNPDYPTGKVYFLEYHGL